MKLILLVFCLVFTASAETDYEEIPLSVIESDIRHFGYLNFGVDRLLEVGRTKNKIPSNPFDITQIYKVSKRTENAKDLYKFEVELVDHKGSILTGGFVVGVRGNIPTSLESYSYDIDRSNDTKIDYYVLEEQYEDPLIQSVLAFGLDYVIGGAKSKDKLDDNEKFHISKIKRIFVEVEGNWERYKVACTAQNEDNSIEVTMEFVVRRNKNTGQLRKVSYDSHIDRHRVDSDYEIPETQYGDPLIQSIIAEGLDYVIDGNKRKDKIRDSEIFHVTRVKMIFFEESDDEEMYQIRCVAENVDGSLEVSMEFKISRNKKTGKLKRESYDSHIDRNPDTDDYELPESQYGDPLIQTIIAEGLDYVIDGAKKKDKIDNDEVFYVTKIKSIYIDPSKNQDNYEVNCIAQNEKGSIEISMEFVIIRDKRTGKLKRESYDSHIDRD